ncbi:hypothetical protein Tco_0322308 [Tanacetum coccineum]
MIYGLRRETDISRPRPIYRLKVVDRRAIFTTMLEGGGLTLVTTTVAKSSSQPWLQIYQFALPRCESSQLYLRCADMEPDKKGSEAAMAGNTIQVGLPRQVIGQFSPIIE